MASAEGDWQLRSSLQQAWIAETRAVDGAWLPAVNVYETASNCIVIAELPGISPDELTLEVEQDGRTLLISGTRLASLRLTTPPERRVRCHQLEIVSGRFERRVALPCSVDAAGATAELRDGLLQVALPRMAPPATVRIPIRSTDEQ